MLYVENFIDTQLVYNHYWFVDHDITSVRKIIESVMLLHTATLFAENMDIAWRARINLDSLLLRVAEDHLTPSMQIEFTSILKGRIAYQDVHVLTLLSALVESGDLSTKLVVGLLFKILILHKPDIKLVSKRDDLLESLTYFMYRSRQRTVNSSPQKEIETDTLGASRWIENRISEIRSSDSEEILVHVTALLDTIALAYMHRTCYYRRIFTLLKPVSIRDIVDL